MSHKIALRRARFWLSAVPLFPLLACSSDLSVPTEAQLGCKGAADCPSGWTCNEKVGRCVKTENIDSTAPALDGDVTVVPTVLKKGAKATVSLLSNWSLSPPLPTSPQPFPSRGEGDQRKGWFAGEGEGTTTYVYSYSLTGSEEQTGLTVTVDLMDEAGNTATGRVAGSFVPDFVAPSVLAAASINKTHAKAGDEVTVAFSVSEALKADPAVTAGAAAFAKKSQTGNDYVFAYTLSGTEAEGMANIAINLVDAAENVTNALAGLIFTVDFGAPKLSGSAVATPTIAKKGQLVTLDFDASEELGAEPQVTLAGKLMNKLAQSSILREISTSFYSGGVGYPAGVTTNGTDLKVWDEGQWKVIATNTNAPGAPGLLQWSTTDPQQISRLFFGDQQTLNFAVTPTAPNGTGTGEVAVDYAEVTVKYRLP